MQKRQTSRLSSIFVGLAVALFLSSLLLVSWSAGEEPFYGDPSVTDGLLNVGLGSILIFCWVGWAVALCVAVLVRRVRLLALLSLLVPLLSTFYLYFAVFGYLHDRVAYAKMISEGAL